MTKEREKKKRKTSKRKNLKNLKILLSALTEILECCFKMEEKVQGLQFEGGKFNSVFACNLLFYASDICIYSRSLNKSYGFIIFLRS